MEYRDQSRAGHLLSSSLSIAKCLISGTKTVVKDSQIEGMLNLKGLNFDQVQIGKQHMPEKTSLISEPVVFGQDDE